jgi:hypothetical protein
MLLGKLRFIVLRSSKCGYRLQALTSRVGMGHEVAPA